MLTPFAAVLSPFYFSFQSSQRKIAMLQKKLLAAAVAGAFALPGIVLAADPPKSGIPTLDQVLEASGVTLNGYIDAGYEYSNRSLSIAYSTPIGTRSICTKWVLPSPSSRRKALAA